MHDAANQHRIIRLAGFFAPPADAADAAAAAEKHAALRRIWEAYGDSWSPSANVAALLSAHMAEDVSFATPDAQGHTRGAVQKMVEGFQPTFPGATIPTRTFYSNHGGSLALWDIKDATGNVIAPGFTYARYEREEGKRIVQLAGFWKL